MPRGMALLRYLLAGPQWLQLDDGRNGDRAIPVRHQEQNILNSGPVQERVRQGALANAAESVLDDAHDGFVCLLRDDLCSRKQEPSLHALNLPDDVPTQFDSARREFPRFAGCYAS